MKNSWKCCGFGLFSCWQLWFHEKNCQKKFGRKTRENVADLESKINRDNLDYWHPGHPKSLTWSHIFVGVGSVNVLSIVITLLIDPFVCNFTRHFFWNKGAQTTSSILFLHLLLFENTTTAKTCIQPSNKTSILGDFATKKYISQVGRALPDRWQSSSEITGGQRSHFHLTAPSILELISLLGISIDFVWPSVYSLWWCCPLRCSRVTVLMVRRRPRSLCW